ncbi:batD protein [Candidatus Magnetomorum sp. HK-1]|nr:batD protein [Candidatus Magnetomorum sp. HK-1]
MKKKYFNISFIILALFFLYLPKLYANPGLTIHVDRTEVSQSDSIKMTIKVSGTQSAVRPRVAGLQNFRVQSGGTSSNFSMVNGQVSSSIDQTYYLFPKKIGRFNIGPAEVEINGKTYRSNHVTVTVQKQSSDVSQQSHQPVFLTVSLSSPKTYVGQTIFYTVKFYYNVSVRDLGIVLPEGEGISLKQLGKPSEYSANVKGKKYNVIEIHHALTTEKTGTFTLAPTVMKMNVLERQQRNRFSVFDNFFTSARPHSVQSQAVKLTILPLPEANRPLDFTGLVGEFSINAQLDPQKIPSGESTTLSLQISGQGNVQLMPDINIPEIENIKVYADQPVISINETPSGFTGQKSMKWALVPQKEGEYSIGPFSLSFFSPKNNNYKTVSTSQMKLMVTPGKKIAVTSIPSQLNNSLPQVKKEVTFFQRDILPVHDHAEALHLSAFQELATWHRLSMFMIPPLVYLIIVLAFFRKTRLKIEKLAAKKAFSRLNKQLNTGDMIQGIPEILKVFNQFFNDRLQREGGTLTPDEVQDILISKGIESEMAHETKSLLVNLEAAVYTGQSDQDVNTLKNAITELAKKLDKGIKG